MAAADPGTAMVARAPRIRLLGHRHLADGRRHLADGRR
jgi:hypothetical protein